MPQTTLIHLYMNKFLKAIPIDIDKEEFFVVSTSKPLDTINPLHDKIICEKLNFEEVAQLMGN